MANKVVVPKKSINKVKAGVNPVDKIVPEKLLTEKVSDKKPKKVTKPSTAFDPASIGSSAVDAVKAHSSRDVRGSSGLANTGTIISYE